MLGHTPIWLLPSQLLLLGDMAHHSYIRDVDNVFKTSVVVMSTSSYEVEIDSW